MHLMGYAESPEISLPFRALQPFMQGVHVCAQRWIDTQPIVATHWEQDAAKLAVEMEASLLESAAEDARPMPSVRATTILYVAAV